MGSFKPLFSAIEGLLDDGPHPLSKPYTGKDELRDSADLMDLMPVEKLPAAAMKAAPIMAMGATRAAKELGPLFDRMIKAAIKAEPRKLTRGQASDLMTLVKDLRFKNPVFGQTVDSNLPRLWMQEANYQKNMGMIPEEKFKAIQGSYDRYLKGVAETPVAASSLADHFNDEMKFVHELTFPTRRPIIEKYPPLREGKTPIETKTPNQEFLDSLRYNIQPESNEYGVGYRVLVDDPKANRPAIGRFHFHNPTDETLDTLLMPGGSYIDHEYQKQGLGTKVYKMIEESTGRKLVPDTAQTENSRQLWIRKGFGKEFGPPLEIAQPADYQQGFRANQNTWNKVAEAIRKGDIPVAPTGEQMSLSAPKMDQRLVRNRQTGLPLKISSETPAPDTSVQFSLPMRRTPLQKIDLAPPATSQDMTWDQVLRRMLEERDR